MRAKLKVFICVYKFCGYKKRAVRPFGVCTDFGGSVLPPNATSNGGDASRVGKMQCLYTKRDSQTA